MTPTERVRSLKKLQGLARVVEVRERCNAALSVVGAGLPGVVLTAIATLAVIKIWRPDGVAESRLALVPVLSALILVTWAARASMRRLPALYGAVLLDRSFGLTSRLTNSLSFTRSRSGEASPMEKLAIDDGLALDFARLRPSVACPMRKPPALALSLLLFGALAGLATLEVRTERIVPARAELAPLLVSADDLELFRQWSAELEREARRSETVPSVHRVGRLIEDMAERRLDRREALRRIAAIEQSLVRGQEMDREALEAALDRLARELKHSSLTKPVADALEARRLDDAVAALQKLAETMKRGRAPSPVELERLRQALERASITEKSHRGGLAKARDELERRRERLLQKKSQAKLGSAEEQELESLERQHERLERDRALAEKSATQMTELEKQLAQAARDLMKDAGRSAQDLDGASEAMRGLAARRLSAQEQRKLLERLRHLREVLRQQQGQGRAGLGERLSRFSRHARGEKSDGDGRPSGTGSRKPGKSPGEILGLIQGPGATQLHVRGPGSAAGESESVARSDTTKTPSSEPRWGTGEGPEVRGNKTALQSETHDTTAVASDTGQGSASSEVIQGAAERGFIGHGYRDVYTAYEAVAERSLEADEIPPGYRLYVRRYFQLIRPRE